jgi:protein-tyrosine phosphatase
MFTKIYWIQQFDNSAKLGIMARPRGDDWLEGEIENLKRQNVGLLVSLLEENEITELGLTQEEILCKKHFIPFINFPIADRGTPKDDSTTDAFIKHLASKIEEGISVVVHCRMGIGRSSIISASILLLKSLKTDTILRHITQVRGLKVPDTAQQVAWLKARE